MTLLLGLGDGIIPSVEPDVPAMSILFEKDSGTWVDIAADMRAHDWQRGRNRETDQYQAGRGSVTLSNADRKYDPENTAGTYYGKLRPNRRLQILSSFAGITYPDIVGYVDRWSQRYTNPNDATAVVTFTDAFKVLNRQDLPRSIYAAEVAADLPSIWWHLDETASSPTTVALNAGSVGTAGNGTYVGPVTERGLPGLVDRDPGTAIRVQDQGGLVTPTDMGVSLASTSFNLASFGSWAIEFWVRPADTPIGVDYWVLGSALGLAIQSSSGGQVWTFLLLNSTPTQFGVTGNAAGQVPNQRYHIVAKYGPSNAMAIYVNGTKYTTAATASTAPPLTGSLYGIGNVGFLYTFGAFQTPATIADEFAIYTAAGGVDPLSDARVAAHYQAGTTPWAGDLPGARANRILDLAAIPAAARNIDTCSTTLQSTPLVGSALAYLQKIADTENGQVFIGKDGRVRFIGRQEGSSAPYRAVQATFGDGAGEIGYTQLGYDNGEETIINLATVSRDEGIAVPYEDAASQLEFQTIDITKDGLLHDSDTYSLYYAQHLVNANSQPISRVGEIEVLPMGDPSSADSAKRAAGIFPAVLALELFKRVTVKRRPQGVGAVISQEMMVDQISRSVGPRSITCRFQLSPVSARKYWRAEIVGYGEAGTNTRAGF